MVNLDVTDQKAKMLMRDKKNRMQTSTHIQKQNDNHASAVFLAHLAKNVLVFIFRKLEVL